jgi:hypothetical protein
VPKPPIVIVYKATIGEIASPPFWRAPTREPDRHAREPRMKGPEQPFTARAVGLPPRLPAHEREPAHHPGRSRHAGGRLDEVGQHHGERRRDACPVEPRLTPDLGRARRAPQSIRSERRNDPAADDDDDQQENLVDRQPGRQSCCPGRDTRCVPAKAPVSCQQHQQGWK